MSTDLVKLKFVNTEIDQTKNGFETFLYWPACNIPDDAKYTVTTSPKTKKVAISAQSHVNFCSSETCDSEVDYYFATKDNRGKLVCQPAQLFRMFPICEYNDNSDENDQSETNRLTKREQMDELKEKFGSRRSQRDLASKRKYEIQFGSDDIDNLPTAKETGSVSDNMENIEQNTTEVKAQSSVLPKRNDNAKSISEVYSLRDIIEDTEIIAMKEFEEPLFNVIKNEFIKSFVIKTDDSQMRIMAIYTDLLLQLVKLSAYEMKKADPLPLVMGDIKKLIFERYTSTRQQTSRSLKYVITDQNKDRIFVHIILLIIMLNEYKFIELEKLQTNLKIPVNNIRRMVELIGCYIENMRSPNGTLVKIAKLKLPLNVYNEPKGKFRR
ncbi:hypothetical protein RDWZM_007696 [Blomia tropicalis]|uniref:DNA-directed RNA polymerase I subunit RPA49 n=1 Tax=Blomia tropicalis TaxID=40697 RepID=A0A9Q0LZZ0_BLOTA|nr:hypothetical protein BLOT_003182 [Blomia tropicalis]KAJ6216539.1 hypothetical protein RDWZM_007696 [Blomia tropicalis]